MKLWWMHIQVRADICNFYCLTPITIWACNSCQLTSVIVRQKQQLFSSRGVAWNNQVSNCGHRKPTQDVITPAESAVFARRSLAPTARVSETTSASMDEITKSYRAYSTETRDCQARIAGDGRSVKWNESIRLCRTMPYTRSQCVLMLCLRQFC